MKTRKYNSIALLICLLSISIISCDDYLNFEKPGTTLLPDAFNTQVDAESSATAAYVPLEWEYWGTFYPEWWIGDVCSDDALKGGEFLSDMASVYDLENFKTLPDNDVLWNFYRTQYVGNFRCNMTLENVAKMDPSVFEAGVQNRVLGEVLFLRAYYHFRLVRVFGGVPVANRMVLIQSEWKQARASADEVYDMIYKDLKTAIQFLPERSKYKAVNMGRATKGAARALLMKAYMNNHLYNEAKLQGDSIINSNEYALAPNYKDNFSEQTENNKESLFEIQYITDDSSDYGDGAGFTRGTFTVILTRPRWGSEVGWGFNRPSQELYDQFEAGDPRREVAIYSPTTDQVAASNDWTNNKDVYLGNRYSALKYAMMRADTTWITLDHATRAPVNRREIRYSDVLLMYAEACCKKDAPDAGRAKWALEEVRKRARQWAGADVLPEFPNYTVRLQCVGQDGERRLQDNIDDLYLAIQHERRVELAMEGHRWFDLKRWGILGDVMNHYRETTKPAIGQHIAEFVKGKHEIFPIPTLERDLNSPMPQNPGYDGVPVQ